MSTPLPKSERKHLFVCHFNLDRSDIFVFFEGTVAAGIPLNDEKFEILYGNHITVVGCTRKTATKRHGVKAEDARH